MVLVKKWPFFHIFFLGNIRPRKFVLQYSGTKKRFSSLPKKEVQKVEKLRFFQRGWPMVLVQKWSFFHVFFLGNIDHENLFYNILEQKNAFLAFKKNTFKKSQNLDFCKGHSFGQKRAIFPCLFFLGNIGQENVFYNVLEQKNAFLA